MIGKLDRRVIIQERSTSSENDFGEPVEGWATVKTVSAKYEAGGGAERRISAQEQASHPATFIMHSSVLTRSITPGAYRFQFDGGNWDIESNVEHAPKRRRYRSITATRRVS